MTVIDLAVKVEEIAQEGSDINEHIPTLLHLAQECEHITEMGVRWIVSTWAFLAAFPLRLVSYDILDPSVWKKDTALQDVYDTAAKHHIDFEFIQANVLDVTIEPTDMLFLDTWHSYRQVKKELTLHASKVRKYILLHDTTTYADHDEKSYESWGDEWQGNGQGVWPAIEEFLQENDQWKLHRRYLHNNGLTVLRRL